MLEEFDRQLTAWKKKKFRRKIRTHDLFPQISEDDAMALLRISTIQAIHNARAYCRNFDQLSGPQQMALTQLVFQMGVNLEEFTQFLFAINHGPMNVGGLQANPDGAPGAANNSTAADPPGLGSVSTAALTTENLAAPSNASSAQTGSVAEYWKAVQETLIHSDWARRYSTRAISVIAMFDPAYESAPWTAEAEVRAEVRPIHRHRRRAAVHTASVRRHKSSAQHTHKS
jgi:hypothetical protein